MQKINTIEAAIASQQRRAIEQALFNVQQAVAQQPGMIKAHIQEPVLSLLAAVDALNRIVDAQNFMLASLGHRVAYIEEIDGINPAAESVTVEGWAQ